MTVVIDHGVTKDPVKPGNNVLIIHTRPALQSARERGLQDIFSGRSRFDASFEERQKLPVRVNQPGNRFR